MSDSNEAKELRSRIEQNETQLRYDRERLAALYRRCSHQWGDIIYDPIYHEAYTSPGDPPGTMGVDWRGPTHVPAQTIKRWRRVCKLCGKVEETQRTTKQRASGSIPGTLGEIDVPQF